MSTPVTRYEMRHAIYKYTLTSNPGRQSFLMPYGAVFLSAQLQHGRMCMWFQAILTEDKRERSFVLRVTGGDWDASEGKTGKYLGTYLLENGDLVLHLYEVTA